MKFAVEVTQLDGDGMSTPTTGAVIYRQVFEDEDFDLKRIVAGVNGISTRKRSTKPEAKKKVREAA